MRLTGDAATAEDVVQETFLRAWRTLHRLDPGRSALPWLLVVARNVTHDLARRSSARPRECELIEDAVPLADGAEDTMMDAWALQQALTRLSAEHRSVLAAVFLHGHSVTEAAEELGIPVGTVKSRTYYGLRALRVLLEEEGFRP
jgi:RNA polymerase sigma-70 factor (ECF subfamily)